MGKNICQLFNENMFANFFDIQNAQILGNLSKSVKKCKKISKRYPNVILKLSPKKSAEICGKLSFTQSYPHYPQKKMWKRGINLK